MNFMKTLARLCQLLKMALKLIRLTRVMRQLLSLTKVAFTGNLAVKLVTAEHFHQKVVSLLLAIHKNKLQAPLSIMVLLQMAR